MVGILLALLIIIPIIEIYLFIEIGGAIGAGWTIVLIIATALLGLATMRRQGLAVLAEAQAAQKTGHAPLSAVAHGVLILFGGALLLTPGFFTDAFGFFLMWRLGRLWVLGTVLAMVLPAIMRSFHMRGDAMAGRDNDPDNDRNNGRDNGKSASTGAYVQSGNIIEGDFTVQDDKAKKNASPKHKKD